MVKITIDASKHGWYFIELNKDGSKNDPEVVNVKFDRASRMQKATAGDFDKFAFKVFDGAGKEISSRMKLPAVESYDAERTYFKFYNPTDQELAQVKKWLPTDSLFNVIQARSFMELDSILQKNKN